MKIVLIILGVIVVAAAIAGGLWYFMVRPLYRPGMVRAGKTLRAPLAPPAQDGDPNFWQVEEDVRLHHFAAGEGRNVLVVHGGPGMPYVAPWPGLDPLAGTYTFHYYDQRGCGQSTRPVDTFASSNTYQNMQALDRTLGLGAQIADVERIRRLLGDEQVVVVGHSFGAFLAALYAAEFPQRVAGLVLVAPADVLVLPQESGGLFAAVRERLPAGMVAEYDDYLERYLNFRDVFAYAEADLVALNREFGRYYEAASGAPTPEQGEPGGWMVQAMYLSMGRRHDYRGALAAVAAPVLVVHGADDLQPEAASRVYAGAFANADFQVIVDAGHFPFTDRPAAFAAAVAPFLQELD